MKMEQQPIVFNRLNESLKRKSGQAASIHLYPLRGKIRFNAGAVELMKIQSGDFIDFLLYKGGEWCVLNSDKSTDGYSVISDTKKREHQSMTINCSYFIKYFLESLKLPPVNCGFYLVKDVEKRRFNGKEVTTIMTNKTIEQILKQSK